MEIIIYFIIGFILFGGGFSLGVIVARAAFEKMLILKGLDDTLKMLKKYQ